MSAGEAIHGEDVSGTGAVHAHGGGDLVAASHARQLVAGPHSEDGANSEVGVHNGGAVKGVKSNAEAACRTQTQADSGG